MKRRMLIAAALVAVATYRTSAQTPQATYVGHDKVAAGGVVVTQPDLKIQMGKRTETGESEVHDKETDTFYIFSGTATFVTGGQMVGSKLTGPGQYRGTGITGGTTHTLTKGDVMVVPAGMPHWFKEVKEPIDYYVVKVIAP
jgi:mannose-6-phosphate isomerase-like protein (cupin superfamily)